MSTNKEGFEKSGKQRFEHLGKLLTDDAFRTELYAVLDSYKNQPRRMITWNLGEISRHLNRIRKKMNHTVFDVISSHPDEFNDYLEDVEGEEEKRQLRLLHEKYNAFYSGLAGSYPEEWRVWRTDSYVDLESNEVILKVTAERRDGKLNIWIDDAQSILRVVDTILDEVVQQVPHMKKEQLRTVESRINTIRKTLSKQKNYRAKKSS